MLPDLAPIDRTGANRYAAIPLLVRNIRERNFQARLACELGLDVRSVSTVARHLRHIDRQLGARLRMQVEIDVQRHEHREGVAFGQREQEAKALVAGSGLVRVIITAPTKIESARHVKIGHTSKKGIVRSTDDPSGRLVEVLICASCVI